MTIEVGAREVAVNFSDLSQPDARELSKRLRAAIPEATFRVPGVRTRDAIYSGPAPDTLNMILVFATPAALYAGKKAIDVLAAVAEEWLKEKVRCEHRKIALRGPDGRIVKIVECNQKHPNK